MPCRESALRDTARVDGLRGACISHMGGVPKELLRALLDASYISLNLFQLQAKEECPSPGEEQMHGLSFLFLGCWGLVLVCASCVFCELQSRSTYMYIICTHMYRVYE